MFCLPVLLYIFHLQKCTVSASALDTKSLKGRMKERELTVGRVTKRELWFLYTLFEVEFTLVDHTNPSSVNFHYTFKVVLVIKKVFKNIIMVIRCESFIFACNVTDAGNGFTASSALENFQNYHPT